MGATQKYPHLSTKQAVTSTQHKPTKKKAIPLPKASSHLDQTPNPQECLQPTPPQCTKVDQITREAILRQLHKLKPYKASGPDDIPNIVLMKCADLIIDRLYFIYSATYNDKLYYAPWKAFNTIVLQKPGKPSYETPKAYRPITLINTLWKVLTAILAKQLTFYAEKHQLLRSHHFRGRPGHTTTDAMHLLMHTIKSAWHKGKVAAVLFLDIEGAFPNAVPAKLIHNLRKRRVLSKLIRFAAGMLCGHVTTLKFNDYSSLPIPIDNGIRQGDPLLMALYQFYNANLLDIPNAICKSAIAYVDNALLIATADTFMEAHQILMDMMTRQNGVTDWSTSHNSPLEYNKLALINFAHQRNSQLRLPLQLLHKMLTPTTSAKYLGVIFDQNLNWKIQLAQVAEKGTKWSSQIHRATRPSWGITLKYAKRLYISVALPKVLYAIDIWCTPVHRAEAESRSKGLVAAVKCLAKVQRAATIAITGTLHTSPTDTLDAYIHTIPVEQLIEKWCLKAAVWLSTLPLEHPLYKLVKSSTNRNIIKHKSPLHYLMCIFKLSPTSITKITKMVHNPLDANTIPLQTSIASSKEESKTEATNALESIKVYSDGSKNNGKVGAATILLKWGQPHCTLHFHLGSDAEHTI